MALQGHRSVARRNDTDGSVIVNALAPHFTVEDAVAEGDKVVVRGSTRGPVSQSSPASRATGRSFTIAGIDIYRVTNGWIKEHRHVIDQLFISASCASCRHPPRPNHARACPKMSGTSVGTG